MSTLNLADYTEQILAHIAGKEWVTINELEQQIGLSRDKVSLVLDFLEFSKFVDMGKGRNLVKINDFGNVLLNIS